MQATYLGKTGERFPAGCTLPQAITLTRCILRIAAGRKSRSKFPGRFAETEGQYMLGHQLMPFWSVLTLLPCSPHAQVFAFLPFIESIASAKSQKQSILATYVADIWQLIALKFVQYCSLENRPAARICIEERKACIYMCVEPRHAPTPEL